MKKSKIQDIMLMMNNYLIMDYPADAGTGCCEHCLLEKIHKFKDGIFFTEEGLLTSIKQGGKLVIYDNLKDKDLVDIMCKNHNIEYTRISDNLIYVNGYIGELRALLDVMCDEKISMFNELLHEQV